jgi:hypothetical protein
VGYTISDACLLSLDQKLNSKKTIAIVSLFGLIYYQVFLQSMSRGFANQWKIYLVNPQSGEYEPVIRGLGKPPDLHRNIRVGPNDPMEAVRSLYSHTLRKLNEGLAGMRAASKDSIEDES